MITKENIKEVLLSPPFCFYAKRGVFTKHFGSADEGFDLEYNFESGEFIYPNGVEADRNTTMDEHQNESFVVFLCVAQLFERGYLPHHLKLEGRNYAGNDKGYCDILVKDNNGNPYLIIECKTANVDKKEDEFRKHWAKTMRNGDQLFRYFNTYRRAKYLCLYSADYPGYRKNGEKVHRFENIYHVISLVDNEEYLQTDSKLKSFREMREQQGGSDDFFNVWKLTYKQDYNTRGLFEPGIEAFNIGNKSYGVADLQTIDEYSLDKKYNEFALILRKHTISSHENAFDKLVNLFLAKIIDERYNSKELQLLWKGAAYDDYFSLQDRLINLYKRGMKEFFDDEVASVENWQIEDAFKFLTARADEARDTIKKYFRRLKYFNNNPFAFLDVHNEQLFYKNAVILKDTISMLQDIYLTKNTDNQFLGDLFEGFLNRGVHQSEGQFFTPMPIVRFLVSSLPLRQLIEGGEIPKAIDYACGAGHFLTEYARQIRPFIEDKMNLQNEHDLKAREEKLAAECFKYYEQIVGIEKDYRLSKVSQVAAFMYGMDGIHIHYGDGLEEIPGIKDHTYSVLVANPPYSVSGFMETLTEEDRDRFTLSQYVSNIEKNNSIETFFIERAAQLLKSGGVAAIVLPSSILSKGGLYMRTRELLLKNFDIVSICSFGPNTFGQTNTSTVVLFLRRKSLEPDLAKHAQNRVDEWFKGNMADNGAYKDSEKLAAYIKHMGYSYGDYVKLLNNKLPDTFLETDMAKDYVKALNIKKQGKNTASTSLAPEARKVREEAQKFVKSSSYKDLTPASKLLEERRYTLNFIREIEKEKLYYYLLAASNPQPVLVVQSPSDKEQEKKFLGYEWSNRKGDEGIHYLNTGKIKSSSSDDEEADDDTIEQIKGIDGIQTPMFDPLNLEDNTKLNAMIRQNFDRIDIDVLDELEHFGSQNELVDLLDFSRVEFDKIIKTVATLSYPRIETKFESVKLANIAPFVSTKVALSKIDVKTYVSTENMLQNRAGVQVFEGQPSIDKITEYQKGDILISNIRPYLKKIWKAEYDGGCSNDVLVFRNVKTNEVLDEYLYSVLSSDIFFDYMMVGKKGVKMPRGDKKMIPQFEIPLPPMNVQKKIAEECEKIDAQVEAYNLQLKDAEEKIEKTMSGVDGEKTKLQKLCSAINPSKSDVNSLDKTTVVSFVEMSSVSNDGYIEQKVDKTLADVRKGSYTYFAEGDIIIAKITPCMENGKCALATDLTNGIGFGSSEFHVFRVNDKLINNVYLFAYLNRREIRTRAAEVMTGSSGHRRVPISFYEDLEIPVPSMEMQMEIAKKYKNMVSEMEKIKQYIANSSSAKQAILDKYLK